MKCRSMFPGWRRLWTLMVLGSAVQPLAPSAWGGDGWLALPTNNPDVRFEVDKASIRRSGDIVRFQERVTYLKPLMTDPVSGKAVGQKTIDRVMNCKDETQGLTAGATYGLDGGFISAVTLNKDQVSMAPVPPGTIAAQEMELACRK